MLKSPRFHLTYLLIAVFGVIHLHDAWTARREVAAIPYSDFQPLQATV